MRNPWPIDVPKTIIVSSVIILLLAFLGACFGLFGDNVQELIVDLLSESRTQRVRIVN